MRGQPLIIDVLEQCGNNGSEHALPHAVNTIAWKINYGAKYTAILMNPIKLLFERNRKHKSI